MKPMNVTPLKTRACVKRTPKLAKLVYSTELIVQNTFCQDKRVCSLKKPNKELSTQVERSIRAFVKIPGQICLHIQEMAKKLLR